MENNREVVVLMEHASAVYEPMIPMGWIGGEPAGRKLGWQLGAPVPADWTDVVLIHRLPCGIEVTAQRRGFIIYDFADWIPGVPVRPELISTIGESSRAAKPALVQRLRVINAQLTLLHAAALTTADESPTVLRVGERDLFRHDVDDDGKDTWSQPFGPGLTTVVTATDLYRFGVMPTRTFTTALDWLDRVVAHDLLVEFDLLNQAQTAVSTHDYPLAVVAGWTVCELRTRALAHGLRGISRNTHAADVCAALEMAGRLAPPLVARLVAIRRRRNDWLHSGIEPREAEAVEAMQLAAELLRQSVPELLLRPTSNLLIL